MPIDQVALKKRREIAAGTMAFTFEKPEGFTYKPGQFGDFTIADPPETDAEGNVRGFSLASAPYEDDLMVATRMRDTAFKRVIKKMELGTKLTLDAPYGSFTLHHDSSVPAVFLSGGIGVTPIRSMILQAAHDKLPHKITLLYANRTPEDAAFLDDFTQAQNENRNFTFVPTMTQMNHSSQSWSGETGHIDAAMLSRAVGDLKLPIFYVSGPRQMVAAMRETLNKSGVDDD